MKPIINIQENIGKTVGRRRGIVDPLSPGTTKAQMVAWKRAFGTPHLPKGVFRFKTHEEADAWMLKMLTRVRKS
jgi:hypothetical protein